MDHDEAGKIQVETNHGLSFDYMQHINETTVDIEKSLSAMQEPISVYYYPPEEIGRFGSTMSPEWDRVSIYLDKQHRYRVIAQKRIHPGEITTFHRVDYVMRMDQNSIWDCMNKNWIHRHGPDRHEFLRLCKETMRLKLKCHGHYIGMRNDHTMPIYAGQYINDGYKLGCKRLLQCLNMENPYAQLEEYKRILIKYYKNSLPRANVIPIQPVNKPIMAYIATRVIEPGEEIMMCYTHTWWFNHYGFYDRDRIMMMDYCIQFHKWYSVLLDHLRSNLPCDEDELHLNPEFLNFPHTDSWSASHTHGDDDGDIE